MKLLNFLLFFFFSFQAFSQSVPIPEKGCYLGAFTPSEIGGQAGFETLQGKPIAVEMNYYGLGTPGDFPVATFNAIVAGGAIPHMTWEPWASGNPAGPNFNNTKIINGDWDTFYRKYAKSIKAWGKPLFIRWGHEMNGNWYPWGGANNGGAKLDGYGDPTKADGVERYIDAYRHVVDLFRAEGVTNVTWIWCPNIGDVPNETWNKPENYYPGDSYVDWIGFDGYNWGTSVVNGGWASYYITFNPHYQKFKGYGKPLMIGEFSSTELGGDKAKWIKEAFLYLKNAHTQIKCITWFNINKETDWRINSSATSLAAWKLAVEDDYFISSADSVATSVENNKTLNPGSFSIGDAYPNPFNGQTTFSLTVTETSTIKAEIYNLNGQKAGEFSNRLYSPGTYTLDWTPSGDMTSGVYLFRITSGNKTELKKVIYLK